MGISASIANSSRKYRTNEELPPAQKSSKHSSIEVSDDDDEELRSVQSFRPSSPLAHQDARSFAFDKTYTKQYRPRNQVDRHSYHGNLEPIRPGNRHIYHPGSLDRGSRDGNGSYSTYSVREPLSRALVSPSTSSIYGLQPRPARTMRDVREYLFHHPELLAGKKNMQIQQSVESDLYGLSTNHKQMKTKQSVYMGLIKAPIIYGAGARPDHKQLKVDQKLYLNLVYPTLKPKDYHSQVIRPRPPLKQEGMVVVRKDDYLRQPNRYVKRPLPHMLVSRVPEAPSGKNVLRSVHQERTISRGEAPTSHRSRSQSRSLTGNTPQKAKNDYVDFPDVVNKPLTSRSVRNEPQVLRDSQQMNGFVKSGNSQQRTPRHVKEDSEVVFTFNVDELNLRKKTGIPRLEHDKEKGQVVPLYFRKSLAYSPKYEYSEDLLSSPL